MTSRSTWRTRIASGRGGGWAGNGLIRTENGGTTWAREMTGIVASQAPNLTIHPEDPDVVMASGNLGFLPHITRDRGESWSPMLGSTQMADEAAFSPHDPDRALMISESTQLLTSTTGGATWRTIAPRFSADRVYDVSISAAGTGTLYASNLGTNVGYFPNLDGVGQVETNWLNMLYSPDYAYDLERDPVDPTVLYATYSPKIFESFGSVWRRSTTSTSPGGWDEVLRVADCAGVTSVKVDPSDRNTIYAASVGEAGRIWVSTDRAASWSRLAPQNGLTFVTVHELAVDPANEMRVWAAAVGRRSLRVAGRRADLGPRPGTDPLRVRDLVRARCVGSGGDRRSHAADPLGDDGRWGELASDRRAAGRGLLPDHGHRGARRSALLRGHGAPAWAWLPRDRVRRRPGRSGAGRRRGWG